MTNGEYWKDEVLSIVSNGNEFGVIDNEPVSCADNDCNTCGCIFNDIRNTCSVCRIKWLYEEHIEKPTLTKKERMFCELVETGYIARDEDGKIFYFKYMPVSCNGVVHGHYWSAADMDMTVEMHVIDCLQEGFEFIKGTDKEPWNVEELLKLEVTDDLSASQNNEVKEKDN